jgi:hypothetical protein
MRTVPAFALGRPPSSAKAADTPEIIMPTTISATNSLLIPLIQPPLVVVATAVRDL